MSTDHPGSGSGGSGGATYVADHHRDPDVGPAPDAAIKPHSPTKLTKQSWRYIGKKTISEFQADQCTDIAAALTYYAVLAIFPGLIALTSVLGLVGQSGKAVDTVLSTLRPLVTPQVLSTVEPVLRSLATSSSAGFALAFGLLGAIFSASGYVNAFSRAMNRIYEVDEGRPIYKLRPQMMLVTLVALLMTASVLIMLIVSGPLAESIGGQIGRAVNLEGATTATVTTTWAIAKWPIVFLFVVAIVALLYYATPNIKQPRFRWISVGAALAILIWILASVVFAFYVSNFGSYDKTYGTLAGVVVALLWLWITNLALLLGAELDSELERGRELQAGIPAEEELRLPARDVSGIVKSQKKDEELLEHGRRIREQADPDGEIAATYGVIEEGVLVTTDSAADRRRQDHPDEADETDGTTDPEADRSASHDQEHDTMSDDTAQPATDDTESSGAADGENTDDSDTPEEVGPSDAAESGSSDGESDDPDDSGSGAKDDEVRYERDHPTAPPKGQRVSHAGTQGPGMNAPQRALVGAGIAGAAFMTLKGLAGIVRSIRR